MYLINYCKGVIIAVLRQVTALFRNKSVAELAKLQENIEGKLSGDTAGVDVGYWESLLSQLKGNALTTIGGQLLGESA